MRYFLAIVLLLSPCLTCLEARGASVEEIKTLLEFDEKDTSFLILGILTLDYDFGQLLGENITLSEVASAMINTLDIIDDPNEIPAYLRKNVFPDGSTTKMKVALETLRSLDVAGSVSWQQATRRSYTHGEYAPLEAALTALSSAGIVLPLAYLDSKYRPNAPEDGDYFLPCFFLDHTDWRAQYGTLRYIDLLTTSICSGSETPCDPNKVPEYYQTIVDSVQSGIQLEILRVIGDAHGNDCCMMPARKCYTDPDLGCTTGTNGFCTLGSYYCP